MTTGEFTLGATAVEDRARKLCEAAGYGAEPDPALDVEKARAADWPEPCRAGWLRFEEQAREAVETEAEDEQMRAEGWEWAIVEIFGHRRHAGRVREEERFGTKMLRIDVPNKADAAQFGWSTHYYGGSSIFSFSLTDRATVMRINKPYDSPARVTYRPREEPREEYDDEPMGADDDDGAF